MAGVGERRVNSLTQQVLSTRQISISIFFHHLSTSLSTLAHNMCHKSQFCISTRAAIVQPSVVLGLSRCCDIEWLVNLFRSLASRTNDFDKCEEEERSWCCFDWKALHEEIHTSLLWKKLKLYRPTASTAFLFSFCRCRSYSAANWIIEIEILILWSTTSNMIMLIYNLRN